MRMKSWQELANPRDLTKIFQSAGIRSLALAARERDFPLHRPDLAALSCALPLWREDRPGRRVRLRGGRRRHGSLEIRLGEFRLCHGGQHQPLVQALRLVHAIRGVESGGVVKGTADPHLSHRRRRRRGEIPKTEIAIGDRREAELARTGSSRSSIARTRTTPPSSARNRCKSPPSTRTPMRRRMRMLRRACPISSPAAALPTT